MAIGKGGGVYDPEAEQLLLQLKAGGIVLLVVNGARGSGFSVSVTPDVLVSLPGILDNVAKQLRADIEKLRGG